MKVIDNNGFEFKISELLDDVVRCDFEGNEGGFLHQRQNKY